MGRKSAQIPPGEEVRAEGAISKLTARTLVHFLAKIQSHRGCGIKDTDAARQSQPAVTIRCIEQNSTGRSRRVVRTYSSLLSIHAASPVHRHGPPGDHVPSCSAPRRRSSRIGTRNGRMTARISLPFSVPASSASAARTRAPATAAAGSPSRRAPEDRSRDVALLSPSHEIASRYGCMTLLTRQIFAKRARSFAPPRWRRVKSFSASTATSIPILLRNLKQSATVLAAL